MKKLKILLQAGLWAGVLTVTACSEEVIINKGEAGVERWVPGSEELLEYGVRAVIRQPERVTRAGIHAEGAYAWDANDTITLWNRNVGVGYDFAILPSSANGADAATADFAGKAYFGNEHKIVAVYPKMAGASFNEWGHISLPSVYSQAGAQADTRSLTYMMASGKCENGQITNLEFTPLTALLDFHLTNVSDATLKLHEMVLEADKEVFPTEVKVDENGSVTGYAGMGKTLTLNLNEQELSPDAGLNACIPVLPTAYGDTRLIADDTQFTLSVRVWNGSSEQVIRPFVRLTMRDLAEKWKFDTSATAGQFKSGCRYEMNLGLEYRTVVPAAGYVADESGNIHIYNVKGLYEWNKVSADYSRADVVLETRAEGLVFEDGSKGTDFDLEQKEINLEGKGEWTPVSAFYGTFEGNGFVIRHITIKEKGFFENNSGTIKNLAFDAPKVTDLSKSAGTVVMTNSGTLLNCHVKNAQWTIQGNKDAYVGLLAAEMGNRAVVEKCSVTDCQLTSAGAASFAGLVGKNAQGTVSGCFSARMTMRTSGQTISNTPDVGGLVAYLDRGFVKSSYSVATLTLDRIPANVGGLLGRVNGGTVLGTYSSGKVESAYVNGKWQSVGGLVGKVASGKVIGCYSTFSLQCPSKSPNVGGFCGINNGTSKENYYTWEGASAAGEKVDVAGLEAKAGPMNTAVREADAKFGFGFFKNEDADTRSGQPLVLKPLEETMTSSDALHR